MAGREAEMAGKEREVATIPGACLLTGRPVGQARLLTRGALIGCTPGERGKGLTELRAGWTVISSQHKRRKMARKREKRGLEVIFAPALPAAKLTAKELHEVPQSHSGTRYV